MEIPPQSRLSHARWLRHWHGVSALLSIAAGVLAIFVFLSGRGHEHALKNLGSDEAAAKAIAPPPVPDAENAALVFQRAFSKLHRKTTAGDVDSKVLGPPFPAGYFDADGPARQCLALNRTALELAQQACHMPRCDWNLRYEDATVIDAPHFKPMRSLAHLFLLNAEVDAVDNRWADVDQALRDCQALRRHIATDKYVLAGLIQLAISQGECNEIAVLLAIPEAKPAPADFKRLRSHIDEHAREDAKTLEEELTGEGKLAVLTLTQLATGTGAAARLGEVSEDYAAIPLNHFGILYDFDRAKMQEAMERIVESDRLAGTSLAGSHLFDDEAFCNRADAEMAFMTAKLMPIFGRLTLWRLRYLSAWRRTALGVAALEWRAAHAGDWPPSLDVLEIDPAFRLDPLDMDGKPLQAQAVKGVYYIWSVGWHYHRTDASEFLKGLPESLEAWRKKDEVSAFGTTDSSGAKKEEAKLP